MTIGKATLEFGDWKDTQMSIKLAMNGIFGGFKIAEQCRDFCSHNEASHHISCSVSFIPI
jgi:hypothetical protein